MPCLLVAFPETHLFSYLPIRQSKPIKHSIAGEQRIGVVRIVVVARSTSVDVGGVVTITSIR